MADNERLIADIMGAQMRLQHLFAYDRSDPLFTSNLTLSQLKIMFSLSRLGTTSGRELAGLMGVSLATLSGMVDRLVAHGFVARHEDPHDRRVRRITLTAEGSGVITDIITAGADKQRRLLDRMDPDQLATVLSAMTLLADAATAELGADVPACPAHGAPAAGSSQV